jgi:hypothetical protein
MTDSADHLLASASLPVSNPTYPSGPLPKPTGRRRRSIFAGLTACFKESRRGLKAALT